MNKVTCSLVGLTFLLNGCSSLPLTEEKFREIENKVFSEEIVGKCLKNSEIIITSGKKWAPRGTYNPRTKVRSIREDIYNPRETFLHESIHRIEYCGKFLDRKKFSSIFEKIDNNSKIKRIVNKRLLRAYPFFIGNYYKSNIAFDQRGEEMAFTFQYWQDKGIQVPKEIEDFFSPILKK